MTAETSTFGSMTTFTAPRERLVGAGLGPLDLGRGHRLVRNGIAPAPSGRHAIVQPLTARRRDAYARSNLIGSADVEVLPGSTR
jgi:hypothetical protein